MLDKLAIGVLLLLARFSLNRAIESYKSRKAIENQIAKIRDEKCLEYLESQLSEFYWPLYIRLEKGLPHHYFTLSELRHEFKDFEIKSLHIDSVDHYCLFGARR